MNDQSNKDEEIVTSLYEAVLNPTGWQPSMMALSRRIGADTWSLAAWEPRAGRARFTIGELEFEKELKGYQEYYGAINPARELVINREPGHWIVCSREFDNRFVERNEFYQDLLIPTGMRYTLGCTVIREGDTEVQVGFIRAKDRGEFTDEELRLAQQFFPHLQLAMRIYLRTELLRVQAAIGQAGLNAIELALVATTDTGRVVYTNRKAEAIFSESKLISIRNQLISIAGHANRKFHEALSYVSVSGRAKSLRVGDNEAVCLVDILPLVNPEFLRSFLLKPSILVLLHSAQHKRVLTTRQLIQLFNFSPAEARLARALALGILPEVYAHHNDLSLNTVKTQLRCIREKTGFRRSLDFVRVVTGVPSVRDAHTHHQ